VNFTSKGKTLTRNSVQQSGHITLSGSFVLQGK